MIRDNRDRPFFLYLAHNLPHVPLFASSEFLGRSPRGLYGDVVEEIDHGVGRILDTLRQLELDRRTLVVFTSDNGPWLLFDQHGGSAGPLREGKGCTWEGGMREPGLFWWPGRIRPAVVADLGSTLDLLPTCCAIGRRQASCRSRARRRRPLPCPRKRRASARDTMFFYRDTTLYAVRQGLWKAHFTTQSGYGKDAPQKHDPPLLFHLGEDPSEKFDLAAKHPEVVARLVEIAAKHRASFTPAPSQLEKRITKAGKKN